MLQGHTWYSENMEKNSKIMQFGADADNYMNKKLWNSNTYKVNQWDLYNIIAGA